MFMKRRDVEKEKYVTTGSKTSLTVFSHIRTGLHIVHLFNMPSVWDVCLPR